MPRHLRLHRVIINAIVILTSPWHDDVVWAFIIPPTLESLRGTMSTEDWNTRLHDNADESSDHSFIDLDTLTVPVLKERLRARSLPVSGRKVELIERLRASVQMPMAEFSTSNVDVSINDNTLDST